MELVWLNDRVTNGMFGVSVVDEDGSDAVLPLKRLRNVLTQVRELDEDVGMGVSVSRSRGNRSRTAAPRKMTVVLPI